MNFIHVTLSISQKMNSIIYFDILFSHYCLCLELFAIHILRRYLYFIYSCVCLVYANEIMTKYLINTNYIYLPIINGLSNNICVAGTPISIHTTCTAESTE